MEGKEPDYDPPDYVTAMNDGAEAPSPEPAPAPAPSHDPLTVMAEAVDDRIVKSLEKKIHVLKRELHKCESQLDTSLKWADRRLPHLKKAELKTKGWTIIKNMTAFSDQVSPCFWGKNVSLGKLKSESEGYGGFVKGKNSSSNKDMAWVRCQVKTADELIGNVTPDKNGDIYVAPGASIKLLREKEEEGFDIVYDKIDKGQMNIFSGLKRKKSKKKSKKKKKKSKKKKEKSKKKKSKKL